MQEDPLLIRTHKQQTSQQVRNISICILYESFELCKYRESRQNLQVGISDVFIAQFPNKIYRLMALNPQPVNRTRFRPAFSVLCLIFDENNKEEKKISLVSKIQSED